MNNDTKEQIPAIDNYCHLSYISKNVYYQCCKYYYTTTNEFCHVIIMEIRFSVGGKTVEIQNEEGEQKKVSHIIFILSVLLCIKPSN